MIKRKLQKNKYTDMFFITIPKTFIEVKKWRKGKKVSMGFDKKGRIIIK